MQVWSLLNGVEAVLTKLNCQDVEIRKVSELLCGGKGDGVRRRKTEAAPGEKWERRLSQKSTGRVKSFPAPASSSQFTPHTLGNDLFLFFLILQRITSSSVEKQFF